MKSRKLLALFLAIFMLASLVVPASAEITPDAETTANTVVGYNAALVKKEDLSQIPEMKKFGTDGYTDATIFKIVDIDDWDAFDAAISTTANESRGLVGYKIYLANDLDFKGAVRDPLGKYTGTWTTDSFAGVFDGQGHIIKNLTIRPTSLYEVALARLGLFSKIMPQKGTFAEIKNLIIDKTVTFDVEKYLDGTEVDSPTRINIGALVGTVDSGYGDTAKTKDDVGTLKVTNVLNLADVSCDGSTSGGLIAWASGCILEVENCTNAGNIVQTTMTNKNPSANNQGIGGIIGALAENRPTKTDKTYYMSATVKNCRNSGDISVGSIISGGYVTVGGIVGGTHNTGGDHSARTLTIENCINNGNISYTGGSCSIACDFGAIYGTSDWEVNSITGCTNYGTITTTNATAATVRTDDCESKAGQLDFTYNMTAQYYQLSKTAPNGKYSLRLVALHNDITAYDSFGYDITIAYNDKTVKASLNDLTTVNTSIAADSGMGATLVSATELGGEYVSAVRIDNISTDYGTLTVTITPKMTAKGATEPTLGTPITFTVTPNYN